jgi:SAM-dependent methyltransferase
MKEASKSLIRRLQDANFARRYFVGDGMDIGGLPDPLSLYTEFFPGLRSVRVWDLADGDAQLMHGVADDSIDFIFSSHCLEHLDDPFAGLARWFAILKPNGHLIITVPDEDLYEQGVWPSTFNAGHRHSFTIAKRTSWSPASINIMTLLDSLGPHADIRKLEVLDHTYRYSLPRIDQTLSPVGECGIEFVVRKRPAEEVARGGRLPGDRQPDPALRVYWNQYRTDQAAIKALAQKSPPFRDDQDL